MQRLIKHFSIHGLYGYKNISLDMDERTTIVVAENGVGKTTLLSALNQILTCNVRELCELEFDEIRIQFVDDDLIVLEKEDFLNRNESYNGKIYEFVANEVTYNEFIDFVKNFDEDDYSSREMISLITRRSPYAVREVIEQVILLKASLSNNLSFLDDKFEYIKNKMDGVSVIYLPTYRRVEKSILANSRELASLRENKMDFKVAPFRARARRIKEIEFGLADVEFKLKAMSEEVERNSNIGYRNLSATMLEDLISGIERSSETKRRALPDIDDLTRFLLRVASRGQKDRLNSTIKTISELYQSGEVNNKTQLIYFLTKLSKIINLTKEKELIIERFVDVCNKYLSISSDSKNFMFDARTLSVKVHDEFTSKPIKLDDLSSGEKQVISLMSHLYLNDDKKIILIDEPELSLSIEWQKMVLPDIDESKNVYQVLAITHSPFIFDNRLRASAKVLTVEKVRK
ncbi:AAA family ATPase [Erwinia mallotivora]|uniref:AAA family ATPase n=1 Tax=Erwinia mallotivora TaxID=69222 RepID=UPI0021C049F4|nr:AAA family ATPase [Erwinia mallotivora]